MPEEFSASTESVSAPDSGGSPAAATAASGESVSDVSTQPASLPETGEATLPPPADAPIGAGWSLESALGAETVESQLPNEDADIEAMLGEPGLDPERTPGLVRALRDARAQIKNLNGQSSQARQQLQQLQSQWEQWGGADGVSQSMQLLTGLIADPQQGPTAFLNQISESALPSYWAIADDFVANESGYLIEKLQERGLLPTAQPAQAIASPVLDADTLASIPEHLRDTAKRLALEKPDVLEDMLLRPEGVRNFDLERELKLAQMDETQQAQARAQWEAQVQTAQNEGMQSVRSLSDQFEATHYQELAKWQPFGPDGAELNQTLYTDIVEGALAHMLKDQKFGQMHDDAVRMLSTAPLLRLHREGLKAADEERKARGLAAQFNARLGQLIAQRVKALDSVFRKARQFDELNRNNTPQRTEVPGAAATASNSSSGVPRLNPDGSLSKEYVRELAARVTRAQ